MGIPRQILCAVILLLATSAFLPAESRSLPLRKRAAFYIANDTGCEQDGKQYKDGDVVPSPQSPCYVCFCQGSSIRCTLVACQFRGDCEPRYVPGECCPRYDHCPPLEDASTTTASRFPFLPGAIVLKMSLKGLQQTMPLTHLVFWRTPLLRIQAEVLPLAWLLKEQKVALFQDKPLRQQLLKVPAVLHLKRPQVKHQREPK
ncbi:hypothetical protein ISCGN_009640 [Ixodes scapularis]